MLITPSYRQQQEDMHSRYDYGTASIQFAPQVAKIINAHDIRDLLDYGAGKMNLMKTISDKRLVEHAFKYTPYEPANPKYSETPKPAQMVACIDVLEHVEPDLIDNVLDDLQRVTMQIGFFTIHCGPAAKTLSDGRNAHLIQEPPEWWIPRMIERFDIHSFQRNAGGCAFLVAPHGL